jgi:holo-[acyl-carrier protein] synthase
MQPLASHRGLTLDDASPTLKPVALKVGIDLASVADVEDAVRVHGERYLGRVFTPREVRDCRTVSGSLDPRRLAARFAAKEATFKALSPGDVPFPLSSVEIVEGESGRPELSLDARARAIAARVGVRDLSVSLAQEGAYATAVVVANVTGDAA